MATTLTPLPHALCAGQLDFIRVQNGVFVDRHCREFTFSGYNAWKVNHETGRFSCQSSSQWQSAALGLHLAHASRELQLFKAIERFSCCRQ